MESELFFYLLLGGQSILLIYLIFRTGSSKSQNDLESQIASIRQEMNHQVEMIRKESTENLTRQFSLIFESLDRSNNNQGKALKDFGERFE